MGEPSARSRLDQLVSSFHTVRARTEELARPLSPEDQTVQSMPDASPTKWHRAHTTWFFETLVLQPGLNGYETFHPAYGYLFNSYYEAIGARHPRPSRGLISRPGAAEIRRYRDHVDASMTLLLRGRPDADVVDLVELGIHHEQQHQELLLMDAKHVLSSNPCLPSYADFSAWSGPGVAPSKLQWIEHPGGPVRIGAHGQRFTFDNERPRHPVQLAPFAIADRAVTCGEWMEFIDDGGYQRPELWLSDGWFTVRQEAWQAPLYWSREDRPWELPNPPAELQGGRRPWTVFTLHGARPVDPSEPACHVSYYEADAFARWAGARLPTEAEWEIVAAQRWEHLGTSRETTGPEVLHPRAVDRQPGFFGDVWEWTASAYAAYPGFHPAAGAVGEYNAKFMVNQHVLRGGCCVTPPGHIRPTYRNFFAPRCRWAFSGLRLARDL